MKIAKKRLRQAVARFKQDFADRPTQALDDLLSHDMVCTMVDEEVGAYRERIYPPLTTLGLFIGQALSADGACKDAERGLRFFGQNLSLHKWCLAVCAYAAVGRAGRFSPYTRSGVRPSSARCGLS